MYILEIIDASTLDVAVKANLRTLAEQLLAALDENESALKELFSTKPRINERQYAKLLGESKPGAKRDELVMHQLAYRNLFANCVYRAQGAQRVMQFVGKALHELVMTLDLNDPSARVVAIACKSLIGKCVLAGADKPNAVVRELTRVADIGQEKIEDAVREFFHQNKTGRGVYAFKNFSSQPIMVTPSDSEEQRALWDATQEASKLFYRIRAAFDAYDSARSKLNLPQFIERLEQAQAESETHRLELFHEQNAESKFDQIKREQRTAEANLFVAASYFHALICDYQSKIDAFAAVIKAAADAIPETRGNKHMVGASNCMGAWHWLREMEMQIEICWKYHDPLKVIAELDFDADAYLASTYVEPLASGPATTPRA